MAGDLTGGKMRGHTRIDMQVYVKCKLRVAFAKWNFPRQVALKPLLFRHNARHRMAVVAAVNREIFFVDGDELRARVLFREHDKRGVGQIHAVVFAQFFRYCQCVLSEDWQYHDLAVLHGFGEGYHGGPAFSEQVRGFRDDCFGCGNGLAQHGKHCFCSFTMHVVMIQQGYKRSGVREVINRQILHVWKGL